MPEELRYVRTPKFRVCDCPSNSMYRIHWMENGVKKYVGRRYGKLYTKKEAHDKLVKYREEVLMKRFELYKKQMHELSQSSPPVPWPDL